MTHTHVAVPKRPDADTHRSWIAVATLPLLLIGGFVLGSLLVGDPNAADAPRGWDGAWRVLMLWTILEIAPIAGIRWGVRAMRRREAGARAALVANGLVFLLFVGVTLIGGLSDALK